MQHFFSKTMKGLAFLSLVLLISQTLTGCSTFEGMFNKVTFGEEDPEPKSEPPEVMIEKGMNAYNVGDYTTAIKSFNLILDEHPFSPQAILAELKVADANYYNKKYTEAKTLYQEFEKRHPTNEAMPYIMFQIGMCDFRRSSRIDRDTSGASDAIKAFTRLLQAYPQSAYAKEAAAKIIEAKEFLVNHEYFVATFYVRTEKYDQAKHRLKNLLVMYPDAAITPKAKALLEKLEAGDTPQWGMGRWLPDFMTVSPYERKEREKQKNELEQIQEDTQQE